MSSYLNLSSHLPRLVSLLGRGMLVMSCAGLSLGPLNVALAESPIQDNVKEDLPTPDQPEQAVPDAKLEELTYFLKRWQCSVQRADEEAIASINWEMIRQLNDLWFFARSTRANRGMYELETWGYNTMMGKFGRTVIGNDGKFANFLSDGWNEDQMVWVGSSSNMLQKTSGKHQIIITKTSDSSFMEEEKMLTDGGEWKMLSTKTCKVPEQL